MNGDSIPQFRNPLIGLPSKVKFESYLLKSAFSIFGIQKGALFASRLPLSMLYGNNAGAYAAMGECTFNAGGGPVVLRHVDVALVEEIAFRKIYNPNPYFKIDRDSVVLDVGANIGIFSVIAGLAARDGRVICLEPEKKNFRYLEDNISANRLSNVTPLNAAVSDVDGAGSLFLGNAVNHSLLPASTSSGTQECQLVRMETLLRDQDIEHVDFMKIDVEGSEFLIFRQTGWLRRIETLVLELHARLGDDRSVIEALKGEGFDVLVSPDSDAGSYLVYARRKG